MNIILKNNPNFQGLGKLKQLEYIKSTGTQYIDTGIYLYNPTVEIKFSSSNINSIQYIFSQGSESGGTFELFRLASGGSYYYNLNINNDTINTNMAGGTAIYNWEINSTRIKNLTTGATISTYNKTLSNHNYIHKSFVLFCKNTKTNYSYSTSIYYIKLYDGNELKLHLVPVLYNDEVCMYDLVSRKFFFNDGTGDFTGGPELETPLLTGLQENDIISTKIENIYIKNCPNAKGYETLKNVYKAQLDNDNIILNGICIDIGTVYGPISELMQYSNFKGLNDGYQVIPDGKPILNGTWIVTSWYTSDIISNAQDCFSNDLTIVGDTIHEITPDKFAIQTINSEWPGYNPGYAILLHNLNYGTLLDDPPFLSKGGGRWILTKNQAAEMTNKISYVNSQNSLVEDTNAIVTISGSGMYDLDYFPELKYFISYKNIYATGGGETTNMFNPYIKYAEFSENTYALGNSYTLQNIKDLTLVFNCRSVSISAGLYIGIGNSQSWGGYGASNVVTLIIKSDIIPGHGNQGSPTATRLKPLKKVIVGFGESKLQDLRILESYLLNQYWRYDGSVLFSYYDYAAPQITYENGIVTMTVERDSEIYYTIDGTEASRESNHYTEPFNWNGQGVIKAVGIQTINNIDDIVKAENYYATTVSNPEITNSGHTITILCSTPEAIIHYTTDGSFPGPDSPIYTEPIMEEDLDILDIRCYAHKDGMNDSDPISKICVLDDTLWGTDPDSSYFALQGMDSTKPNYNPGALVCAYKNSMHKICLTGGGCCYVTKDDASQITSTNFYNLRTGIDYFGVFNKSRKEEFSFTSFLEFKYFTAITTLPNSTNNANASDFNNCRNLVTIDLSNITSIGTYAFYSCTSLETVVFSQNLTNIGENSFSYCTSLKLTQLPQSITTIGKNAFNNTTRVPQSDEGLILNLPNLTSIGNGAFKGNKFLRRVENLGSITTLGTGSGSDNDSVFLECGYLTYVEIPSTVTTIGFHCFDNTTSLVVIVKASTPPTYINGNNLKPKYYVGLGVDASVDNDILALYQADPYWSIYTIDTYYNYLHTQ